MEEESCESERINGQGKAKLKRICEDRTLSAVLRHLIGEIISPDPASPAPLLRRIRASIADNAPHLPEASRNTGQEILLWTRKGSPLRALLVISVGTVTVLASTGLLIFMLFFLAATFNAIIISLLISLAAAGSFLALFFACLTAIYVGALAVAAFVISTATISTVVAVLVASGWIGFIWTIWLAIKSSMHFAKQSLSVTGSAISAWHARGQHEVNVASD